MLFLILPSMARCFAVVLAKRVLLYEAFFELWIVGLGCVYRLYGGYYGLWRISGWRLLWIVIEHALV